MSFSISIGPQRYILERPQDLESLWQQMSQEEFAQDERIPYWVELWPAGIVLAEWLYSQKNRLNKTCCLDIGCGLGITSFVLHVCATQVFAMDYEFQALQYAKHNANLNSLPSPYWLQMDWRYPGFQHQVFSFIWGAGIIYETRFFHPLIELFEHCLATDGIIWLTTPNRQVNKHFWQLLDSKGWQIQERDIRTRPSPDGLPTKVYLWEISRRE